MTILELGARQSRAFEEGWIVGGISGGIRGWAAVRDLIVSMSPR